MSFINKSASIPMLVAQAKAAEKSYVGSLLVSGELFEAKDIRVSPSDIFTKELAIVLEAIIELSRDRVTPDLVTVKQKLIDKNCFYPVYPSIDDNLLIELVSEQFNHNNLRKYESMVKSNALKLNAQKVVDKMMQDSERSASSILQYGQELIGLATNSSGLNNKGFDEAYLHKLADNIAEISGQQLYGPSFGKEFSFLDRITHGIQKGKIYRIGAPSNTGKSQLAYSLINNLLAQGKRVAFFLLENDIETTALYLMSNKQGVRADAIKEGRVPADFDYLMGHQDKLGLFDKSFYLDNIFAKIIEFKPDVVILDYIGLVSIKGFIEEAKYNEYAIQVQRFVKEVQVAWIDLSNLPITLQKVEDIRGNPQFYGSSVLRNNADVGIHVMAWKQFYEMRESVDNSNIFSDEQKSLISGMSGVTLFVSKNRLGPHAISRNYIIDFNNGAKFIEYDDAKFNLLASKFGYGKP